LDLGPERWHQSWTLERSERPREDAPRNSDFLESQLGEDLKDQRKAKVIEGAKKPIRSLARLVTIL